MLKALATVGAYEEGATTCFEAWGMDRKDNTSLCHPWASSAIIAIIEDIAGIKGESFYGDKLIAEPHMKKDLEIELKLPGINGVMNFRG